MNHLVAEYWVFLAVGILLLIAFYTCLWIAGRESEQERRFEARWDLEHEAAENVYPTEGTFHARPLF